MFWNTKDERPINSQGGGIFKFADPATGEKKYYWYGVHYKEADTYRNDPSVTLTQRYLRIRNLLQFRPTWSTGHLKGCFDQGRNT